MGIQISIKFKKKRKQNFSVFKFDLIENRAQ